MTVQAPILARLRVPISTIRGDSFPAGKVVEVWQRVGADTANVRDLLYPHIGVCCCPLKKLERIK